MNRDNIPENLDWFCLHLTKTKCITREECIAILDALDENGISYSKDVFIRVMQDNGIGTCDRISVEKFSEMSDSDADEFGAPVNSIFEEQTAAPVQQAPVPPPQDTPAAPPADLPRFPTRKISRLTPREPSSVKPDYTRSIGFTDFLKPTASSAPEPLSLNHEDEEKALKAPRFFHLAPQLTLDSPVDDIGSILDSKEFRNAFNMPSREIKPDTIDPLDAESLEGWPDLNDLRRLNAADCKEFMNNFLRRARQADCSDVHLAAGCRPFVRRYHDIYTLDDQPVLDYDLAMSANLPLMPKDRYAAFKTSKDVDFCYSTEFGERYRGNIMQQRNGMTGAYRIINNRIRTVRELGFLNPDIIEKLTTHNQGIILLTGPSGCGKTTTMNAMLHFINQTRHDHIITVEDPIETVHEPISCSVSQRELGTHTKSFGTALRAALREDPDIIAIGELRDLETITMALRAAETGHLVLGTLHTASAAATIDRILDVFPPSQQSQVRSILAESIRGVICQQMLPNADCTGHVMASEVMIGTLAIANLIRDGKTFQINSTLQISRHLGMCTMEQCLFELYMNGERSFEQTIPQITSQDLIHQMQTNEAAKLTANMPHKRKSWF